MSLTPSPFHSRVNLSSVRLIDGEWSDEDISDPVGAMVVYLHNLNERPDKSATYTQLTQKWALWLMHEKRVPKEGLKVCSPTPSLISVPDWSDISSLYPLAPLQPARVVDVQPVTKTTRVFRTLIPMLTLTQKTKTFSSVSEK